ncbi:AAA family ATPase [Shewanella sp. SM87]|uniref:ATP-dependent nuclease n=1 Tax=Shewanella sp. SM87 TaxID=2912808 RepID=UPI0021D90498|nr:AAA family ATPase [Shewanella sp. SM87]MCU8007198.1 AAA family ATPase [Shewanella sp. SM87]
MSDDLYYSDYICGLRFEKFDSDKFKSNDKYWHLTNLKKINFFIGQNNSGKSRLLRSTLSSTKFDIAIVGQNPHEIITNIEDKSNEDELNLRGIYSVDINNFKKLLNKDLTIKNLKQTIITAIAKNSHNNKKPFDNDDLDTFTEQFLDKYLKIENLKFFESINFDEFDKIYIPLLRGLRPLSQDIDLYLERTQKDYFSKLPGNYFGPKNIFTGYTIYTEIKAALLGTHLERQRIRKFEDYLSANFFSHNQITLIPRLNEDMVYLKEGDKEERRIADLGDGLQSIIILTFKLFMAEKPTAFFIEEAEQHLHAGMQRALINAFTQHPKHMYFITTHSNHFMDISQELDCISLHRVYQTIDNENEVSYIDSLSDKSAMLADLGVRASSVLLANCSIWVEGITDKLYLSTFMNKYLIDLDESVKKLKLKNYKENLHYIFTEYQGSNITHWDFNNSNQTENHQTKAKSLTSNILLIADRDIERKADLVAVLEKNLQENFLLLDFKEIENHIPAIIVEKAANKRWSSFIKKGDAEFEIFDLTQNVLHVSEGIGSILERYVSKNPSERLFFKDNGGTIKDKVKFCHTAISIMEDPATEWKLTPELIKYCEKIWEHIEKCNPN